VNSGGRKDDDTLELGKLEKLASHINGNITLKTDNRETVVSLKFCCKDSDDG
jgi:hypothetical protein